MTSSNLKNAPFKIILLVVGDRNSELNVHVSSSNEAKKSNGRYSCLLVRLPLEKTIILRKSIPPCFKMMATVLHYPMLLSLFWFEVRGKS